MKRSLSGLFLLLVAFAMVITAIGQWSNPMYDQRSGMRHTSFDDDIGRIEIEIKEHKVWLNIHLKKSMTCQEVIKELEIENFQIETKTFSPYCDKTDDTHMRIVYEETVAI